MRNAPRRATQWVTPRDIRRSQPRVTLSERPRGRVETQKRRRRKLTLNHTLRPAALETTANHRRGRVDGSSVTAPAIARTRHEPSRQVGRTNVAKGVAITTHASAISLQIQRVRILAPHRAPASRSTLRTSETSASSRTTRRRAVRGPPELDLQQRPDRRPASPSRRQAVQIEPIVAAINPREHRLFAGKLDKDKLSFGERALVLAVRGAEGDFRAWDEIKAWARGIAATVQQLGASGTHRPARRIHVD